MNPLKNLSTKPLPMAHPPIIQVILELGTEREENIDLIEVAPGIYQSVSDYEANMSYDEMRDDMLEDAVNNPNDNPVY